MKRRDKLLTFITACIPGVGYMYNGLVAKGIETLAIFIFINIFFDILGLRAIGSLVKFLFWIYVFIDTYRIAERIDRGESVADSDFIFEKRFENGKFKFDFNFNEGSNTKVWTYIGCGLIIVGCISVLNKIFEHSHMMYFIRSNVDKYSLPALFIIFGIFILFRKK